MTSIMLATEDVLSDAIGTRLVEQTGANLKIVQRFRQGGFGYLKKNLSKFCQIAQNTPLILLTDLDQQHCAPLLIASWLGRTNPPSGLLFRVAVREIESWLLADREAIAKFLGILIQKVPSTPDCLPNPKEELLRLHS